MKAQQDNARKDFVFTFAGCLLKPKKIDDRGAVPSRCEQIIWAVEIVCTVVGGDRVLHSIMLIWLKDRFNS